MVMRGYRSITWKLHCCQRVTDTENKLEESWVRLELQIGWNANYSLNDCGIVI